MRCERQVERAIGIRNRPGGRFWARIGRKQVICLAAGLFLGMAAQLWQRTDSGLLEGDTPTRGSYRQGNQIYSLVVGGLEEKTVPMEIALSERVCTKQEALKTHETVMEQLLELVLGSNPSLGDVRQDLNLFTYLNSYGIRLRQESDEPELLDSFSGLHAHEVKQRRIDEQGIRINLCVHMTEGKWPEEYELSVCVKPPVLAKQEQMEAALAEFLKREDELQSATTYMKLSKEYQGRSLQYSLPEESIFVPMVGLGAARTVLYFLKDRTGLQDRAEVRKRQLALDYPEVLSRLTIFLGAGMNTRTARGKIALGCNIVVKQKGRRKRYVYEEMYKTSCRVKGGVPERSTFEEFGRRYRLQSYMKLGNLLEQNRKNGPKNLKDLLRTEITDTFEQRKHQTRRLGEEAETKLLLLLLILLSMVMVMIAVPALIEFKQGIRRRAMGLGKELREFWKDEQGVGVVELVLVLIVLIDLVTIFRKQITTLLQNILKEINSQSEEVY